MQLLQDETPAVELKVPAAQSVHAEAAMPGIYFPAEHALQLVPLVTQGRQGITPSPLTDG